MPRAATTGSTARVRTQGPLTSAGCGDPRTPRGLVPNLLFGFSSVVVLGWSCPCSCPFHLKPRDRRQLMPTKALVSKKRHLSSSARVPIGTQLLRLLLDVDSSVGGFDVSVGVPSAVLLTGLAEQVDTCRRWPTRVQSCGEVLRCRACPGLPQDGKQPG